MSNTNQSEALNSLILSLEERRTQEFRALKDQLKATGESLKPANLIKSAAEELTGNKQLRTYLIQAGIGLAVSLATKKLLSPAKVSNTSDSTSNIAVSLAKLGFKKLTPRHLAIIEMLAPLLIGFVVSAIKRKKKKKAEKNEQVDEG